MDASSGMSGQVSNWSGGGATVTMGTAQMIYGMYLDSKNKRPTYNIPQEVLQNLSVAEKMTLQGLPEEQKQEYISSLQRSGAFGLRELGTRKAGIAGVAALNENQNRAYANLMAQDSAARMENQKLAMQARQTVADYRDQAFQINQLNPYYEKKAEAEALKGAGMQNVSSGFQGGGGGMGSNTAALQNQSPQYKSTQGQQAQPVQTYYMSPYQMEGYNQQTTPNPYASEQELALNSGYNSGFNYGMY